MKNVGKWQKRFYKTKPVWVCFDRWNSEGGQNEDGHEYYESEEAARIDIDWHKKQGVKRYIRSVHVHTLNLAKERWDSL